MDLSELCMSAENTEHNLDFLLTQGHYLSINYGLFSNHNDLPVKGRHGLLPLHPVALDVRSVESMFFPFIDFCFFPRQLSLCDNVTDQPAIGISLSTMLLLTYFGLGNQVTNFARFVFKMRIKYYNQKLYL